MHEKCPNTEFFWPWFPVFSPNTRKYTDQKKLRIWTLHTMLRSSIVENKSQKITYSDYKNFDSVRFNNELKYVLAKEKIISCTKFNEMFL